MWVECGSALLVKSWSTRSCARGSMGRRGIADRKVRIGVCFECRGSLRELTLPAKNVAAVAWIGCAQAVEVEAQGSGSVRGSVTARRNGLAERVP